MSLIALIRRHRTADAQVSAHGPKSLERGILSMVVIRRSGHTLIGSVKGLGADKRDKWLDSIRTLAGAVR